MARRELRYRFQLSDREFARAWIVEHFRRPGLRVWRIFGGPFVIAIGISMVRSSDWLVHTTSLCAMGLGLWLIAKPFVTAWLLARERRRQGHASATFEIRVGADGVMVDDGKTPTQLGWDRVRTAGLASRYVWFELTSGRRGTIPRRAIDDLDRLRELFREHGKWSA